MNYVKSFFFLISVIFIVDFKGAQGKSHEVQRQCDACLRINRNRVFLAQEP